MRKRLARSEQVGSGTINHDGRARCAFKCGVKCTRRFPSARDWIGRVGVACGPETQTQYGRQSCRLTRIGTELDLVAPYDKQSRLLRA